MPSILEALPSVARPSGPSFAPIFSMIFPPSPSMVGIASIFLPAHFQTSPGMLLSPGTSLNACPASVLKSLPKPSDSNFIQFLSLIESQTRL